MNYMTKWYIISIAIVLQDPLICILWGSLNCFFSGRIQNEVWRLEETEERGRLNARNRTLPLASIRLEGRQRSGLQGAAPHLRLPHAALTSLLSLLPSCWTWRVRPP